MATYGKRLKAGHYQKSAKMRKGITVKGKEVKEFSLKRLIEQSKKGMY